MTITVSRRRVGYVTAVALVVLGSYLVGSARSAGAAAPAQGSSALSAAASLTQAQLSAGSAGAAGAGAGTVTMTGSGSATGTPDTLVLSLSVTSGGTTVSSAFAAANTAMSAVQTSLRGHGVAAKDLSTSNVSLQSRYTAKGMGDGYTVNEGLTATLHDIARAGQQISAVVAAGGKLVRVDGVSLDLTDTGALVSKARDSAFADAKSKAQQYARDAGRQLAAVVSITQQAQQPQQRFLNGYGLAESAAAGATVPIAAGSQDVAVQVTVTFALR
jgi:uncharacterized protein YggE